MTKPFRSERKRFVVRIRDGGYVVWDHSSDQAISYPIFDRKEAQRFCDVVLAWNPPRSRAVVEVGDVTIGKGRGR